jgi:hypothetical protein
LLPHKNSAAPKWVWTNHPQGFEHGAGNFAVREARIIALLAEHGACSAGRFWHWIRQRSGRGARDKLTDQWLRAAGLPATITSDSAPRWPLSRTLLHLCAFDLCFEEVQP